MAKKDDVKVTVDVDNMVIKFNGYGAERTYDLTVLNDDIKQRLLCHGANQKLRDSYSGDRANWYEHTDDVWNALINGQWERKAEGKLTKLQKLAENGVFSKKQIEALKKAGLLK